MANEAFFLKSASVPEIHTSVFYHSSSPSELCICKLRYCEVVNCEVKCGGRLLLVGDSAVVSQFSLPSSNKASLIMSDIMRLIELAGLRRH